MMAIPNIIAEDVPIGKDDSQNVEGKVFLEPKQYLENKFFLCYNDVRF